MRTTPKSVIPVGRPTPQSLLAEAAAKGGDFSKVNATYANLVADAVEMMAVRTDVKELSARGYPVHDDQFVRIELLSDLLVRLGARKTQDIEARRKRSAAQDEARAKLSSIRHQLMLIGDAAGLPRELFSALDPHTHGMSESAMRMRQVLTNVAEQRSKLSDLVRVDELVEEAEQLIDATMRRATTVDEQVVATKLRAQVARLLLDVMTHVSKQGLAAFPFDRVRCSAYRLSHSFGKPSRRANDEEVTEKPAPSAPTG